MVECTIPALLAAIGMLMQETPTQEGYIADVVAACEEPEPIDMIHELGGPKVWIYPRDEEPRLVEIDDFVWEDLLHHETWTWEPDDD